ncbi:MAG: tetratricopeptide repeat protein [Myxococcales bacterium]|nr:tetratricopeptide repeat protein [Myxococcales bacterium]
MRASLAAFWVTLYAAQAAAQPAAPIGTAAMAAMVHESALGWVSRADAAAAGGRTLEAEAHYRRALGLDPSVLAASLGLGRALAARGRRDEARAVLEAVSERALGDSAAVARWCEALVAVGGAEAARARLAHRARDGGEQRVYVTLLSRASRFAEALAAARQWRDASAGAEAREAAVLCRALAMLVAEADVVGRPPEGASVFRRALAASVDPAVPQ